MPDAVITTGIDVAPVRGDSGSVCGVSVVFRIEERREGPFLILLPENVQKAAAGLLAALNKT